MCAALAISCCLAGAFILSGDNLLALFSGPDRYVAASDLINPLVIALTALALAGVFRATTNKITSFLGEFRKGRWQASGLKLNEAGDGETYDKVFVLETKGSHLAGSDDTKYKRSVLDLCSELAVETDWAQLGFFDDNQDFVFDLVDEDSWKSQLNSLFV